MENEILLFAVAQWGEKTFERLANKLAEETGEIAGAIVKLPEGRATLQDLDKELGDALIVLSQFAALRGTTLEALRAMRFQQIKDRASRRVPCAACDFKDYQLGHAEGCKHNPQTPICSKCNDTGKRCNGDPCFGTDGLVDCECKA